MSEPLYKRGDLNPEGTHRFWTYQGFVLKSTGKRGERWIPVAQFEKYRREMLDRNELSKARAEFYKSQREKLKLAA
jgi:hypothetical protein